MRVWNQKLIKKLCRNHLLGQWRESLGCHKIITEYYATGKKLGYFNHPQVQQYLDKPQKLFSILDTTRNEMIKRGYNPKPLPDVNCEGKPLFGKLKEWQTLEEQIEVLKNKNCDCKV